MSKEDEVIKAANESEQFTINIKSVDMLFDKDVLNIIYAAMESYHQQQRRKDLIDFATWIENHGYKYADFIWEDITGEYLN